MAGAHTEAVLNKLSKPELVQIILNTEANLGSQIAKLTTEVKNLPDHSKILEADVVIVKNVNNSWSKGLLRPSVNVGKMPNTQGGIHWRWLEYQCLLELSRAESLRRDSGNWRRYL